MFLFLPQLFSFLALIFSTVHARAEDGGLRRGALERREGSAAETKVSLGGAESMGEVLNFYIFLTLFVQLSIKRWRRVRKKV